MGARFFSSPTTAHAPGGGSVCRPASERTSVSWPALADHAITASWIAGERPASTRTHGAAAGVAVAATVGGTVGGTDVSGGDVTRQAARPPKTKPTAHTPAARPFSLTYTAPLPLL